MNPVLKNILVSIGGFIFGNMVNMATLIMGMKIIPAPEGVELSDPQSFIENADKFTSMHFIFPLLAHTLGTFVASYFICRLVSGKQKLFAIGTGLVFLILGVFNLQNIPHPTWFAVVDLFLSYIPMALFGYFVAMKTLVEPES